MELVIFRSAPTYDDNILCELIVGTRVEIVSQTDGWYHVKYSMEQGYVGSRFVDTAAADIPEEEVTESQNVNSATGSEKEDNIEASFTNAFGTPTTKCAHSGCNNYIAQSGNTNCCETHSNKCLECGIFIDEDAMYCMNCIGKVADQIIGEYSN